MAGVLAKLRLDAKQFRSELSSAVDNQKKLQGQTKATTSALRSEKSAADSTASSMRGLVRSIVGVAAGVLAFGALKRAIDFSVSASAKQIEMETKFRQIFLVTKGATEEQARSVLNLASAMQAKGVVEDDSIIAGAAALSSYKLQSSAIQKLLPGIADMVAATKGYKATGEDMVGVSQLMGRAMAGQTTMLTRYGIILNDSQKKIFKYGTESQRAAALAGILEKRFGGVNAALVKTDAGKAVQVTNAIGDAAEVVGAKFEAVKAKILGSVAGVLPAALETAMSAVDSFIASGTAFVAFLKADVKPIVSAIGDELLRMKTAFGLTGVEASTVGEVIRGSIVVALTMLRDGIAWVTDHKALLIGTLAGVTAGFAAWGAITAAQSYLLSGLTLAQWALNGAMTANPVGMLVVGIGAAVGVLTYLGMKIWESRDAIKAFFSSIGDYARDLWATVRPYLQPIVDLIGGIGGAIKTVGLAVGLSEAHFAIGNNTAARNGMVDGSHAAGLYSVPRDNYVANLHKGERVLSSPQARAMDSGAGDRSVSVVVNVNGVGRSTDDILSEMVPRLKLAIQNAVG
jgi:hypothetical protein